MLRGLCWGLSAVLIAAALFTVCKIGYMLLTLSRGPHELVAINLVFFAKKYLLSSTALIIGALIFAITFAIATVLKKKGP